MRSGAAGWLYVAAGWLHIAAGRMYVAVGQLTVFSNPIFFSFCSHTAVNNIHLVLYGDFHIQQALALVVADGAYSEVLLLESDPREEGHAHDDEQPQDLQAAAPNPVLNAAIIKSKDQHVEGEVPPHFPEQASYSSHASTSLCLENEEQYTRLARYMYSLGGYDCVPVAPGGSCMFSSLR